eukprot:6472886-Amphidinium_carterae.1
MRACCHSQVCPSLSGAVQSCPSTLLAMCHGLAVSCKASKGIEHRGRIKRCLAHLETKKHEKVRTGREERSTTVFIQSRDKCTGIAPMSQ